MMDRDRIQEFCRAATENGTIGAAFTEIQKEIFLDWCEAEDAMKRDQLYHTMRALELFQIKFENFGASGPAQQI